MSLSEKLEIFIPTYNRKPYLKHTLKLLTSEQSPVKKCSITVLDNACDDGSSEMIEDFVVRHPNITHIRHPKNIGANANITRCFELAKAPFIWAVCDDDSFCWDNWHEIEAALQSNQYDILLTRKGYLRGSSNLAKIIRQLTFLPAGIYRTKFINGGVLINMFNNIPNFFPHMALICEIINKKGTIFIPHGEIVSEAGLAVGDLDNYLKGTEKTTYVPQPAKEMFWVPGFFNALQMLEDKKLRTYVRSNLGRHGFFGYIFHAFKENYTKFYRSKLNESFIMNDLNFRESIEFFFARTFLKVITVFNREKKK